MGSSIRAFDWYQNHRPWMTFSDLERPKRTLSQKRCVLMSPLHTFSHCACLSSLCETCSASFGLKFPSCFLAYRNLQSIRNLSRLPWFWFTHYD